MTCVAWPTDRLAPESDFTADLTWEVLPVPVSVILCHHKFSMFALLSRSPAKFCVLFA